MSNRRVTIFGKSMVINLRPPNPQAKMGKDIDIQTEINTERYERGELDDEEFFALAELGFALLEEYQNTPTRLGRKRPSSAFSSCIAKNMKGKKKSDFKEAAKQCMLDR